MEPDTSRKPKQRNFVKEAIKESNKRKMFEIDVREIKEFQSVQTGHNNNMTMRRNREKIYYAVWKKAFETAIKIIADKREKQARATRMSQRTHDKGTGPTKDTNDALMKRTMEGYERNKKVIETEHTQKVPEEKVSVKIFQKRGIEVLTIRKEPLHIVRNKGDPETRKNFKVDPQTKGSSKTKNDKMKMPEVKSERGDKVASQTAMIKDGKRRRIKSADDKNTISKSNPKAGDHMDKSDSDASVFVKVKVKNEKEVITLGKVPNPYTVKINDEKRTKQDILSKAEDKNAKSIVIKTKTDKEPMKDTTAKEKTKTSGAGNKTSNPDPKSEIGTDNKPNRANEPPAKGTKQTAERSIQVIRKGEKHVLTLNKIPENAAVKAYKPATKKKKDIATKTQSSGEMQIKTTDKTDKGPSSKENVSTTIKQTNVPGKTDKSSKLNSDTQYNKGDKGTSVSGGTIQVILKGQKEVMTLQKPTGNAMTTTYKPDTKTKPDKATKTNSITASELKRKKPEERTDKRDVPINDKISRTKENDSGNIKNAAAGKQGKKHTKTPISGGAIQVILKGEKVILPLSKIPDNAVVNTYKPDVKERKDDNSKEAGAESSKTTGEKDKERTSKEKTDKEGKHSFKPDDTWDESSNVNGQDHKETKGTTVPGSAIQVIQKGEKEDRKIPDDAVVNTYEPDMKLKEDGVSDKIKFSKIDSDTPTEKNGKIGTFMGTKEVKPNYNRNLDNNHNSSEVKLTENESTEPKGSVQPSSIIQVILKGQKEVFTLRKPSAYAQVNIYQPDIRLKQTTEPNAEVKAKRTNGKNEMELDARGKQNTESKQTNRNDRMYISNKDKLSQDNKKDSKGTIVQGDAIHIIQTGEKEVLTLRKPPENAVINAYVPASKRKTKEIIKEDQKINSEFQSKKTQDKTAKEEDPKETKTMELKLNDEMNIAKSSRDKKDTMGTVVQGSAIKVIQRGGKKVLTFRKPSENALVSFYKPSVTSKNVSEPKSDKAISTHVISKEANDIARDSNRTFSQSDAIRKGDNVVLTSLKAPQNAYFNTFKTDTKSKLKENTQQKVVEPIKSKAPSKNASDTEGDSKELKGTIPNGDAIQVIQKGDKEILTFRKPSDNAAVNIYTPGADEKDDIATLGKPKNVLDANTTKQTDTRIKKLQDNPNKCTHKNDRKST